jgi:hypothetical protein
MKPWGQRIVAVVYIEGGNDNAAALARGLSQEAMSWGASYAGMAIDPQSQRPEDMEREAVCVIEEGAPRR